MSCCHHKIILAYDQIHKQAFAIFARLDLTERNEKKMDRRKYLGNLQSKNPQLNF